LITLDAEARETFASFATVARVGDGSCTES
jgi:hypothetical protein